MQTFEFEGAPGHVKLDTTTLEQRGGKTLVRTVSAFPSVQDRDAIIAAWNEAPATPPSVWTDCSPGCKTR